MIFMRPLMPVTQVLMAIVSALRVIVRRLMIALRRCTAIIKVWMIELQALTKITQACVAAVHFSSRANSSFALIGLAM